MNILSQIYNRSQGNAGVFSPGVQDRATLESDLSGTSGPSGESASVFYFLPDGSKAINSHFDNLGLMPKLSKIPTSLDNSKHLGIFKKPLPERKIDSCWVEKRESLAEAQKKVAEVLKVAGKKVQADAVRNCGTEFHAFKTDCCGDTFAIPHSCNHRLCPLCMRRRSAELADRVKAYISRMRRPKFISLTIENVKYIDKEYFTWVRKCFTKLRHRKIFDKCLGGVYTIETTYNGDARTWHVHLHIVVDIPYVSQEELSKEWEEITETSFVVWIEKVGRNGQDVDGAAKELSKYVVKPGEFLLEPDLVGEYLDAVKGMRLVQVFGNCLGMELEDKEAFSLPDCWCGLNRWRFVGWYIPLGDVYRDRLGFYRLRGP
jgi:hypothetical protein